MTGFRIQRLLSLVVIASLGACAVGLDVPQDTAALVGTDAGSGPSTGSIHVDGGSSAATPASATTSEPSSDAGAPATADAAPAVDAGTTAPTDAAAAVDSAPATPTTPVCDANNSKYDALEAVMALTFQIPPACNNGQCAGSNTCCYLGSDCLPIQ